MCKFSLGFFDLFLKAWSNLRDSSFSVEKRTSGKAKFLFSERFLQDLTKFLFREEDWALGNYSMWFWDFPNIS